VVKNPALTNPMDVLHLFITDANWSSINNVDAGRFAASIYFLGEFYDNVGMNRHGQSSQGGKFLKKSFVSLGPERRPCGRYQPSKHFSGQGAFPEHPGI
jgi:hypothetical protein